MTRREPEQAVLNLHAAVDKYRETGARQLLPWAYSQAAKTYLTLGYIKQARAEVSAGLKVLADTGIRVYEPELCFWEAQCLMRQGQSAAAESVLKKFSKLSAKMQVKNILRDSFCPPGLAF